MNEKTNNFLNKPKLIRVLLSICFLSTILSVLINIALAYIVIDLSNRPREVVFESTHLKKAILKPDEIDDNPILEKSYRTVTQRYSYSPQTIKTRHERSYQHMTPEYRKKIKTSDITDIDLALKNEVYQNYLILAKPDKPKQITRNKWQVTYLGRKELTLGHTRPRKEIPELMVVIIMLERRDDSESDSPSGIYVYNIQNYNYEDYLKYKDKSDTDSFIENYKGIIDKHHKNIKVIRRQRDI